ncbi:MULTISPECIES: RNA polymerase sigma-70 factor [unclassified Carboxylicivirga]|uniref:RNA polymerase sigma-70 factor n=1 Tax=Carboxylicivirga TaxID=1628153 RepID=UPI003D35416F
MEDVKLCEGLLNGERKSLEEVYSLYHQKIFSFAFSYLKNEDDAYDLVQEVFIKLWTSRATLDPATNLDALVFTVTKNAVLSLFRKRASEKKYLDYLAVASLSNNAGTQEISDYNFLEAQYEALIEALPQRRREIFILSRKKGLSNALIAQQLGVSEKTVENQMTKALSFLKEHLVKNGMVGSLFCALFLS